VDESAHAAASRKGRIGARSCATLDMVTRWMSLRRPLVPCLALLAACAGSAAPAAGAQAAGTLTIDGRGFGHGVGLSQYGAYGYATHGRSYRQILAHYYTGTRIGTVPTRQEVRVLLATGRASVTVTQADHVGAVKLDPRRAYRLEPTRTGGVIVRDDHGRKVVREGGAVRVSAGGGAAPVKLRGPAGDDVTDGEYRGHLVIRPEAGGRVSVVDAVPIEDYVRGVVGAESPAGWPAAALRAQAVAARGYALTTDAGTAGDDFTQYPDTRSQVYHGVAAETAATDAAVAATRGQVVTYRGAPIVTYFFSTSGGRTENGENGFPGAEPQPYLVSVKDPYDGASPQHTWRVRMTLADAAAKLGGLVQGDLERIVVLRRGVSRRVLRARIVGSRGGTEVDGPTLRRRLGLMDTWARFSVVTSTAARRTVRRAAPAPAAPAAIADDTFLGAVALRAAQSASHAARQVAPAVAGQSPQPTTGSALSAPTPTLREVTRRVRVRTLRGHVTISGRRSTVRLRVQRRGGAHWRTVATVHTGRRGGYAVRVAQAGDYRVRAGALVGPVVHVR
jgi:stage II sporulation protein D